MWVDNLENERILDDRFDNQVNLCMRYEHEIEELQAGRRNEGAANSAA